MNQKFYTNVQLVGNQFLVRAIENGKRIQYKEDFRPTLFIKSKKKTQYKTLTGEYVEPIQPGTVKDCRNFYSKYEDVDGFEIYGNERYLYQYISEAYSEDEIEYDKSKIDIYALDIEVSSEQGFPDVESASEELLLITLYNCNTKQVITWGRKPFNNQNKNVIYHHCPTEYELLNHFLSYWISNTPDIITSWNGKLYDIPYICRRMIKILGEKQMKSLSPWNMVSEGEIVINGRKHITYDILGVSQLDYLDLYKKFTYKAQESYRLDYIAEVELGQKKLDHSEFETFKDFYTKNWEKFVYYNILDAKLVDRLEEKMKLIELALTMAYDAKVNYDDVFYQVRMWDSIIYNYLKKKNIVVPPKVESQKNDKYAGAYVKEPVPGMYDWVVTLDLDSMYPHLIMQFNIGPDTIMDKKHPFASVDKILRKEIDFSDYQDYCVCPNGALYRRDIKGFIPELMERMYNDRKNYKKKMLEAKKRLEEIESEIKRRSRLNKE